MDKKLMTIAEHLRKAFPGDPTIHEYVADDGVRCVNIINTPTNDGVTYLGTIGCSERKMKGLPPEKDIRIELISAVEDKFSALMAETLSFIAFCLDTDNVCYHPGMVIENAIPESNLTKMRHVYLCEPIILNEALSSIQFDEYPVIFLYVLPLTEKELHFFDDNGSQAIEKQLIGNINPYNLNRKSCVFNEIKRKKRTMDRKELSKVALLLEKKFQGDASFSTYGNALSRECPVVDIITTRHPDHVTYIGTIGCSLIPMRQSKDEEEDWRIEFVTAINEDSEELMTNAMLSIATMMSNLENNCCYPGLVIRNTFPEDSPSQMKHLLLAYPFLWDEGLESISVKKTQIRFLQLLPISDAEADFIDKYGYDALEDKMIEQEVLYNDFYRPSCI